MAIARVNHSKLDAEFFLKHHNVAWSFVPNMSLNNREFYLHFFFDVIYFYDFIKTDFWVLK